MEYPVTLRHVGFVNARGVRGVLFWIYKSIVYPATGNLVNRMKEVRIIESVTGHGKEKNCRFKI